VRELEHLQDGVPAMAFKDVEATVEQNLVPV